MERRVNRDPPMVTLVRAGVGREGGGGVKRFFVPTPHMDPCFFDKRRVGSKVGIICSPHLCCLVTAIILQDNIDMESDRMHNLLIDVLAPTCQHPGVNKTLSFWQSTYIEGSLPLWQLGGALLELRKIDSLPLQGDPGNRLTAKEVKIGEFTYSSFGDLKDEFLKEII